MSEAKEPSWKTFYPVGDGRWRTIQGATITIPHHCRWPRPTEIVQRAPDLYPGGDDVVAKVKPTVSEEMIRKFREALGGYVGRKKEEVPPESLAVAQCIKAMNIRAEWRMGP